MFPHDAKDQPDLVSQGLLARDPDHTKGVGFRPLQRVLHRRTQPPGVLHPRQPRSPAPWDRVRIAGREALVEGATSTARSFPRPDVGTQTIRVFDATGGEDDGLAPGSTGASPRSTTSSSALTGPAGPARPHDYSVRDYNNRIIQFQYNSTGLDPRWQVGVPGYGQQFADLDSVLSTWACQQRLNE